MLLFHTEPYPIGLVVEVLLSFIRPYPTLLLHVARLELVLAHQVHKLNESSLRSMRGKTIVVGGTYKVLSGNRRFEGTKISSKKSSATVKG